MSIQSERPVEIKTPLGADVLLIKHMNAREELGRLFHYEIEVLSTDPAINMSDLLGQAVTIRMDLAEDEERFFHGYVSACSQGGADGRFFGYRLSVRPWLWFLTRTADCRIFQEKTVPDIIKDVFREHGFTDFEESLSGSYRTWEYCVQYRETDFNFVSRLMEQEGIYYYFKHEDGKHTLVLADSYSAHSLVAGEEVPFFNAEDKDVVDRDHFLTWQLSQRVQPGNYALNDFDFERPNANLETRSSVSREHAQAEHEIFDHPGEYLETGDGDSYARMRIEELHAGHEVIEAEANARVLACGALVRVSDHPREDQNREYLITSAQYQIGVGGYESAGSGVKSTFQVTIGAIDARTPFRSARTTPKPVVQGPQTAIVCGQSGEQIWTDEYGRVKVQFHWDRYGEANESSSCWIRVSQSWAGNGWGSMHVPHVGHEVIVEFLEGDPDRPIITGRVYNGTNSTLEELPGSKTKSGFRDHGNNELIMEGEAAAQTVHIQQDCGNRMLFDGNSGAELINVKDCGDNEMNMQAHGTKEVFIKQSCGNEMVMNEDDGITLRDKYGNEIILNAADGYMRLASPTHDSFIEIGRSIKWNTDSNNEMVYGADASLQVGGYTHSTHVGAKTEISANVQVSSVNGVAIKKYYAYENSTNYQGKNKRTRGAVTVDSDTNYHIIGGFEDSSQLELDTASAELRFDGQDHTIKLNVNGIEIKTNKKIDIEATGGDVTLKASGDIVLDPGGKVKIPAGKLDDKWIKSQ